MTTFYVDNVTGSDSDDGLTAGNAFLTLAYAWNTGASAGDTIRVIETGTTYSGTSTFTQDGSAGNLITLIADDASDPPIVSGNFVVDCDYGVIDNLIFDSCTSIAISLGKDSVAATETENANNFVVQNCEFRHLTAMGVRCSQGSDLTIQDCSFIDIRSRVAGTDLNAVSVFSYLNVTDVTIQRCWFESIGSDGIHIGERGSATIDGTITIDHCMAFVPRPYGTTTRAYHNFNFPTVDNVAEDFLDIKDITGRVHAKNVLAYQFEASVAGQDASGGDGVGVIVHNDEGSVLLEYFRLHTNDKNLVVALGSGGTTAGCWAFNGFLTDGVDNNLDVRTANLGVRFEHLTITDTSATGQVVMAGTGGSTFDGIHGCYIDLAAGASRNASNTDEALIDYNTWAGTANPAEWDGASDIASSTPALNASTYEPTSTSDLLAAGTNFGHARDYRHQLRTVTPAIGAAEAEQATYEAQWDARSLITNADTVSDAGDNMFVVPTSLNSENNWALKIRIPDTTARYWEYSVTAGQEFRIAFYINPGYLAMNALDEFQILRGQDGATNALFCSMKKTGGNYNIVVSAHNDAATPSYAGATSDGFAIADNTWTLAEIHWTAATTSGDDDGTLELRLDGIVKGTASAIDNDTHTIDTIRWGALAGLGSGTGDADYYTGSFMMTHLRVRTYNTVIGSSDTTIPTAPAVAIDDGNLQGYWDMETESGTREDGSSNGNDLTDNNTVLFSSSSWFGLYAADFEAGNSEYLSIADGSQSGLDIIGDMTACGWVQPESLSGSMAALAKFDTNGNERAYWLGLTATVYQAIISDNGTNTSTPVSKWTLPAAATWAHIAVMFDASEGIVRVWVDGIPEGIKFSGFVALNNSADAFHIGSSLATTATEFLDGLADDFMIFDRIISGAELEYIRASSIAVGSAAFTPPLEVVSLNPMNPLGGVG